MKVSLLVLASLAAVIAEPPVSYLPPSTNYGAPDQQPSKLYVAPGYQSQTTAIIKPNIQYGGPRPNQQYGAPGSGFPGAGYHGNVGYGGAAGYHGEDYNSEPANYNFEYHVQDAQSGSDFGHQEARQGDIAQGRYFVLLPDGRRQIVEYTADQGGYKPKVTYEGTANTAYAGAHGGYTNAGPGGYTEGNQIAGGYQNSGGYHSNNGGYQY